MSAGQPNWTKLHELGKLPKEARGNVPMLAQLDAAEKRIEELEAEVAKLKGVEPTEPEEEITKNDGSIEAKCEVEDCNFIAKGKSEGTAKNYLRLHGRTHEVKD